MFSKTDVKSGAVQEFQLKDAGVFFLALGRHGVACIAAEQL